MNLPAIWAAGFRGCISKENEMPRMHIERERDSARGVSKKKESECHFIRRFI
jgi:hypothetical protein